LLKELPASLRREISIHMHKKIVEKISFFQDKDPQFISYVVPRLKNVRMQAGEILCKEGDYAEEIFFLVKGRVNLKVASGIIFKTYEQGSYFGEVEVLLNKCRQYTIQITTRDAEFLVISKRDFLNILKEFPNISSEVRETAKIREMKNHEAKVFALNMNRGRPREFKRSTTIKSKREDFGNETRGWSSYAQSVTRDPPPEISLGNTTWEKKANIKYMNSNNPYYDIKRASIVKKGEIDENLENNLNPTVASIIFSPAQFQLRKERNLVKGKLVNDFEVGNHSPDVTYNESFEAHQEEPLELRKILVELNYSEAEAEKTLVDTIEMLHEMEEQQKRACDKISEFLDV
jgi:CRP-like cAMP-binding protein